MTIIGEPGALAVYVHWPFCVSKCPYCDFNSHVRDRIDEARWRGAYATAIAAAAARFADRQVTSIFFGGGTPSLMDPATVASVIEAIARHWTIDPAVEVTLEANPGSADAGRFAGYRAAGVNRLSSVSRHSTTGHWHFSAAVTMPARRWPHWTWQRGSSRDGRST